MNVSAELQQWKNCYFTQELIFANKVLHEACIQSVMSKAMYIIMYVLTVINAVVIGVHNYILNLL